MRWRVLIVISPLLLAAQGPAAGVLVSVAGSVQVACPGNRTVPARVFDWLKPGCSLQAEKDARAVVVLQNGARYEIAERSRGTLEKDMFRVVAGNVHRLSSLPEIPKLAAIKDGQSSTRSGAVRIRGPKLTHCYPPANASVVARDSIFSFQPATQVTSYVIEIENSAGVVIHRVETPGPSVTVPRGILEPGATYYWEVQGLVSDATPPQCGAEFSVLTIEDEKRRAALKDAVEHSGDADSLALLAEVDLRMGLLREARNEFAAALGQSSTPAAIRSALVEIDALMR